MTKNHISYFCQGYNHIATDKPCQDYCKTEYFADLDMTVAALSDGHGGDRYFRSQLGSQFAVECAIEAVKSFVGNISKSVFAGTRYSTILVQEEEKLAKLDTEQAKVLRQLVGSIIFHWRQKVKDHVTEHSQFTDWEMEHVEEQYRQDMVSHSVDDEIPVKTYGCTLMVYVQTRDYWFAFHIGDGKCIAFFDEDQVWAEPIPWDNNCFLNNTTSLCNTNALDYFRFCYEGDGRFPLAIFLGSDGMDDSLGESDNLADFYAEIVKMIQKTSIEQTMKSLQDDLPVLSRIGSKDDMSVACVFDPDRLDRAVSVLASWQMEGVRKALVQTYKNAGTIELKLQTLLTICNPTKADNDAIRSKVNEKDRNKKQMEKLKKKFETLKSLV